MSSSSKKKNKNNRFDPKMTTRRGIILISVLAALILVINLVTASYSWFGPGSNTGSGVKYDKTVTARSEKCSFETREGHRTASYVAEAEAAYLSNAATKDYRHDQIIYSTMVNDDVTIYDGETVFFKTEITNSDPYYPSVISLFLRYAPAGVVVCVNNPSNTVREVTGAMNDYSLVRNAYVKPFEANDVDGPGLLVVEWSVTNNSGDAIVFDATPVNSRSNPNTGLYIMYN